VGVNDHDTFFKGRSKGTRGVSDRETWDWGVKQRENGGLQVEKGALAN